MKRANQRKAVPGRLERPTRDEDASVLRDLELTTDELDLGIGIGDACTESKLDALNLLRDGREDALLQPVELVEATPSSDLAQSYEDPAHRLEVECLVATEDENETTKLNSERLDRFGFACREWVEISYSLGQGE